MLLQFGQLGKELRGWNKKEDGTRGESITTLKSSKICTLGLWVCLLLTVLSPCEMGKLCEQRGTKAIAPASYEMKFVTSSRVTWSVFGKMQSSFSQVYLQHVQFTQAGKFKCSTFSGCWQGASCCHTDGVRLQSKAAASIQSLETVPIPCWFPNPVVGVPLEVLVGDFHLHCCPWPFLGWGFRVKLWHIRCSQESFQHLGWFYVLCRGRVPQESELLTLPEPTIKGSVWVSLTQLLAIPTLWEVSALSAVPPSFEPLPKSLVDI